MEAQFAVADGKEWFWWLSSDKRATVRQLKARESAASKELAVLDKRRAALLSDAKAELGVWSEVRCQLPWRSSELPCVCLAKSLSTQASRDMKSLGALQDYLLHRLEWTKGESCSGGLSSRAR